MTTINRTMEVVLSEAIMAPLTAVSPMAVVAAEAAVGAEVSVFLSHNLGFSSIVFDNTL